MRKILFALVALAFVVSLCFAQKGSAPSGKTTKAAVETKTFTGKVESVSWGSGGKGAKPAIVVVDDKGQKLDFVAKSNASITGKDGKAIMMTDIKKDDKVSVEYVTSSDGVNRAQSIKVE
jgi:hypothetical protein